MWVFLFSRLQTWLLLAIALPLARLLVHRLAVTADRRDPSARTARLLTRPTRQWLRHPAASRAGLGADRATDRQLAESSRSAPAPAPAPDAAGLTGARRRAARDPTHSRSSQLIKPWPALEVARSMAGIGQWQA